MAEQEFVDLVAQVKANTDLEAAAVVAFQGVAAKIADLAAQVADAPTKAALTDLGTQLNASAAALAAAIPANTPAA